METFSKILDCICALLVIGIAVIPIFFSIRDKNEKLNRQGRIFRLLAVCAIILTPCSFAFQYHVSYLAASQADKHQHETDSISRVTLAKLEACVEEAARANTGVEKNDSNLSSHEQKESQKYQVIHQKEESTQAYLKKQKEEHPDIEFRKDDDEMINPSFSVQGDGYRFYAQVLRNSKIHEVKFIFICLQKNGTDFIQVPITSDPKYEGGYFGYKEGCAICCSIKKEIPPNAFLVMDLLFTNPNDNTSETFTKIYELKPSYVNQKQHEVTGKEFKEIEAFLLINKMTIRQVVSNQH